MPALLVPILAQAVALQMGDRTELRVVRDEIRRDLEAETLPRAHLALTWPRSNLAVGYAPSLRYAPIDSPSTRERRAGLVPDQKFSVRHAADGSASVSFGSTRTNLSLSQTVAWALRNLYQEAFSGGAPSSGGTAAPATPGLPSTTQVGRSISRDVNWGAARSGITLSHGLSTNHTLSIGLGYDASGGLGTTARRFYPLIHGPDASATVASMLGPRTQLSSALNAEYNFSEVAPTTVSLQPQPFLLTRSWMIVQRETITHQISRTLSADIGAGVGYARNEDVGQPPVGGVLPTGSVGLSHKTSLAKGMLSTRLSSGLNPSLNSSTGKIDWWYTSDASIGWQGDRWSFQLSSEGDISVSSPAGTNSRRLRGSAFISYDLRHGFSADFGTRAIWEQVNGRYTILPSVVGFVALNWAMDQSLN